MSGLDPVWAGTVATEIERFDGEPVDVLVIGGGIVGAGVARDAAMRGLRTVLVDQADFASGTSSRSSRLLHGGLRYLAQGRLGLVREASREKRLLGRIAPHLAEPLAFLFPTRRGTSWSRWKLAVGVKVYDLLCGIQSNYGRSSVLSREDTIRRLPRVATNQLTGAVRYYDALTNDARLVLDTIRSAAQQGAQAFNYVRLTDAQRQAKVWQCELMAESAQRPFVLKAKAVVNATGPWSDQMPHSKTTLRLTKGVHLVIDRERMPIPDAVVMAEGHRILFAIPWGDRVILGTTDTDYDGPLDNPSCNDDDVAYVLDVVNETFPGLTLGPADVTSAWAGLRPLVADANGDPSDISRRHEVAMSEPGWWDITGGKLTTYRLMAEEAVTAIVNYLDLGRLPCQTANKPLLVTSEVDGISGILPPDVSENLVLHFCRHEWVRHLDDLMIRRTSWRYYHRDHLEIAARAATWMAHALGWDDARISSEVSRYRQMSGAAHVPPPHSVLSTNGHAHRAAMQELTQPS